MSYTSTLQIQIKNHRRGKSRGSGNGCGGLHNMVRTEMVLPEDLHDEMHCSSSLQVREKPGKAVDIKVTAAETTPNLRVVKTSDRYLTVVFELGPHSGGGLCVRRVESPVPILTNAANATKRSVREGPLPVLLEFSPSEGNLQIPEAEVFNTSSAAGREIKLSDWEKPEREGKRAPSTVLASPHKKTNICQSPPASFHSNGSTQDVVSPKRKPHTSGDSLKILNGVSHVKVKKGGRAELRCVIHGTPPLAASWVRNKKPVVDGSRISIHTTDRESCLLIREVCEKDQGNYTLCVQDQTGSTQHHTTLTVVDHPSPPSGKPLISALLPSSLTLSWSGPSYDGGSAVLSYKVEVKQDGQDTWRLLTDTCISTSYHVSSGLVAGERYQFRIQACNTYGESEPGEASEVVTMSSSTAADDEAECEDTVEYTAVSINGADRVDALYTRLEKLGVGKFGQVYKLQEKATGKIRAGKFSKARMQKDLANARAEVELMNKLHHPQLVYLVAAFHEPGWMILVMEYIAGGELFERIVADDFDHTEITSVQYMSQIITGVGHMHKQGIVHLDLKPENIVCVSKVSTKVKIVDFGLARKLEPGVPLKVLQGTAEFVAPEVIAYEPVGFTTDMWSLGVICYILLCGDSPFQGENDMETLRNITSGSWDFDDETDAILSDSAKDFIRRLLQKNMRSRLTAEQAMDHLWIKDKNISSTKTLPKERIKKFLARQKWQKTGKAVLALKRMALLSNKSDNNSPAIEEHGESEEVFSFLQEQLQRPPVFSSQLKDQAEVVGSSARFHCHIEGFPDPEVLWFFSGKPIQESKRFQIEYEDSGSCTLVISNVSLSDVGFYACQASNAHGHAETSAKLIVHQLRAQRRSSEGAEKTA